MIPTDATTDAPADGIAAGATTRRRLLTTGALGAAATAFLAACSTQEEPPPGQSGVDPAPSTVPPTVPDREPSQSELDYEVTMWRTATSLELLLVDAYTTHGPKLTDPEWVAAAERFAADHEAAAEEIAAATEPDVRITEPNAYVQENFVDPVLELMTSDRSILNLFRELESTVAATYIATVGSFTTTEWRANMAAYAASAARRVAVMGNGGEGAAPTGPLYSSEDLLTNNAFLPVEAAEAAATEGDAEAEGDTAGG